MTQRYLRAALVITAMLAMSCGQFTLKYPYERWTKVVQYVGQQDNTAIAAPERITVSGPAGTIEVRNRTGADRGFVITALRVFTRVEKGGQTNVDLSGMENGKTYAFRDDMHRTGPRGEIIVRFKRTN